MTVYNSLRRDEIGEIKSTYLDVIYEAVRASVWLLPFVSLELQVWLVVAHFASPVPIRMPALV